MILSKRIAVTILIIFLFIISLAAVSFEAAALASLPTASQFTPAIAATRWAQPPTVMPPAQADNGAQAYWGMCMSCHGDHGQGLTDEWRKSYEVDDRDCWKSGCHGNSLPTNGFEIPRTGVPAIAGEGRLARFANAHELQSYIHEKMPFSPSGSLSTDQSFELTAFILRGNNTLPGGLILDKTNSSAVSIHHKVTLPENELPGSLILGGVLILAAIGLTYRIKFTDAVSKARPGFVYHLHPPRIPARQSRFLYTLGTGGLSVFLLLALLVTGLLEMYFYIPSPDQAAVSISIIKTLVPYGNLVRNLHFWSAQFLVIVMSIHLLRVVLTGAYAPPRRFNYLLGLGLLVIVLLFDFTGYVLRWDEGVQWALVVGTNLIKTLPGIGSGLYRFVMGGAGPGPATLIRFYAWHIFGLTLAVVILVAWHAFRVRRDGGIASAPPNPSESSRWITRFDLVRVEGLAMTIGIIVLLMVSLVVPAPTDQPISSFNYMTGSSQAPWFFLWVQQLLKWGNPFWLGIMVPLVVILLLGLFPYILPNADKSELGRWLPRGNRIAQVLTVVIFVIILVLTILGALSSKG
jgi:quinol-cytochrome oxidoreductase complex cytochrome b subunit